MLFAFFGSYNYVFQEVYHFNQRHIGLAFLGILVGNLLAVMTFLIFDKTLYAKARVAAQGHPAPEHRLYSAMLGSILLPIGLFVSKTDFLTILLTSLEAYLATSSRLPSPLSYKRHTLISN
jgi:hypothetical protein